jgi:hypothetical protein
MRHPLSTRTAQGQRLKVESCRVDDVKVDDFEVRGREPLDLLGDALLLCWTP